MQLTDHARTVTLPDGRCECGYRPSHGEGDCATQRDALLARDFEQPIGYWRHHRMAVDTYCLQHAAYIKSARSFAAHLCGLCIAFEHGNDPDAHRRLIAWLNTYPSIHKPDVPDARGTLTIRHVSGTDDPIHYGRAVEEWARSTWGAYWNHHETARTWVAQSQQLRSRSRKAGLRRRQMP